MEPLVSALGAIGSFLSRVPVHDVDVRDAFVVGYRLERLSEELSYVGSRSYKRLKDVHGLCEAVMPWVQVLQYPTQALTAKHLPALCELSIPAKLVKYSALALRAAFPLTPLPEQSRDTGSLASRAWLEAIDLLCHISMLCGSLYSNPDPQGMYQAIMDQLFPSDIEEPGRCLLPPLGSGSQSQIIVGPSC